MGKTRGLFTGPSKEIKRFWPMVGPYIASRDVYSELRDFIFDDDQTIWFIVYNKPPRDVPGAEDVLGFCCARVTDTKIELRHDYIRDSERDTGLYSFLFNVRQKYLLDKFPDKPHQIVTNNKKVQEKVRREGFRAGPKRGSYTVFRRAQTR